MSAETLAAITVAAPAAALVLLGASMLLLSRKLRIQREAMVPSSRRQRPTGGVHPVRAALQRVCDLAGPSLSTSELAVIWLAAAALPGLAAFVLGLGPASLAASAAGAAAVPLWAVWSRRAQQRRFEELLGETMPLIATNLRSGSSIAQAIAPVAANMPEPLRSEFARFSLDVRSGTPVPEALDDMADRTGSDDLRLFSTAVAVSQQTGGSLSEITERVGETIRARVELRRFIRAKTSLNRIESAIISIVPVVMLFALAALSPYHRAFYLSPTGALVLALAAALDLVGLAVMRKMGDIPTD